MFWQITVPYIPLAGVYYIAYFQEVKKANKEMPAYKYIREISITDNELIKTTTQKIKRFANM